MQRTSFIILAGTIALLVSAITYLPTSIAAKGDEVFLDEGDGDFESVPILPGGAPALKVEKRADAAPSVESVPKKESKKESKKEAKKAASKEAKKSAAKEKPAPAPAPEAEPAPSVPVAVSEPAPAPVGAEPVMDQQPNDNKPPKSKRPGKPTKSAKKRDPGIFVTTKEACPAKRAPASEAEPVFSVKAARKIWVEQVDEKWVRAYNKAGEPGYVSRDCVD